MALDKGFSSRFNDCMKHSHDEAIEVRGCIDDEYERQDARLNLAYKQLTDNVFTSQRQPLIQAQRAWIPYRDANCTYYFDPRLGWMGEVEARKCKIRMTQERADELERAYDSFTR